MRRSMLPIVVFVVAAVISTSAVAGAGWIRQVVSTGTGPSGGTAIGCNVYASLAYSNAQTFICPVTVDTNVITSYGSLTGWFQNSNPTQPVIACHTFPTGTGGGCSGTATNNCPNRGVCQSTLPLTHFNQHFGDFKFVAFDNLTVGAKVAGFTMDYSP